MKLEGLKENKGITVLALTITIIVLLILSGITIVGITGENGIIQNAIQAKEEKEISEEKEIVEQATVQTMGNNNRGIIEKDNLQSQLDNITGKGKTIVTEDKEEGGFFVKFIESGRIYKVSQTGEVKYLGIEETLLTQAEIIASPESNLTPELVQHVDLTVKTLIDIGDVDYTLVYAWNKDKENVPEDTKFIEATLTGEGRIKKAGVDSIDTEQGEYYLWVRIVIGEIEKEECFGPYAIKDHTTLISTSTENQSESGFLGNTKIQRRNIKSIKIQNSLQGHSVNEENCWDVSQSQNGIYLAWYEETVDGKYEVTIAGEGGVVANVNSRSLFSYIGYNVDDEVTITGLEYLDTGLVTIMSSMFYNCKASSLNLSKFNTDDVESMAYMFFGCSELKNLDLSSFNTKNVKTLAQIFEGCSNLEKVNLESLNTENVTAMNQMFNGCTNLKEIDLSNFNTSKVEQMGGLFYNCSSLRTIDLSDFDTRKVKSLNNMFFGCSSVTSIDISSFDTSSVTNMSGMFQGCNNLINLDVTNFKTENVTDMSNMFNSCKKLTSLNVNNFKTNNVTNMWSMFRECNNLTDLDITNFETDNVTNMSNMFQGCNNLTSLDVTSFKTDNVTNMGYMFENCSKLTELDLSNFNTSKVKNMSIMFSGCNEIKEIDLSSFNTSNVTNMYRMFLACSNITNLNLSNFNTSNVTDMRQMFMSCSKLVNLNLGNFDTRNVTDWESMFLSVPSNIEITTNTTTKDWIIEKFPNLKNNII